MSFPEDAEVGYVNACDVWGVGVRAGEGGSPARCVFVAQGPRETVVP